ncbi:hypothetical protein NQU36_27840, partial [Escherichia coli]|uniref:hypothetical protein n=1 Tax=Escherichia coli TaxID=562 RepID=UPI00211775D4
VYQLDLPTNTVKKRQLYKAETQCVPQTPKQNADIYISRNRQQAGSHIIYQYPPHFYFHPGCFKHNQNKPINQF